jgi:ABC-type phosphate transport system substrate-binding protein
MTKIYTFTFILMLACAAFAADTFAEIVVIANPAQTEPLNEKEIRDLYLGTIRRRQFDLFEQSEGQAARAEFYEKFLDRNENQLKQARSIMVFSGNRVPSILADDRAVYNEVKENPRAIGYVSAGFFEAEKKKNQDQRPTVLFSIK